MAATKTKSPPKAATNGKHAKPTPATPKVPDQKMLIGGRWVESASGKSFPTLNPATGEVICQVAEGDKADIDLAVKAARRAFETGAWRKMNPADRARLMYKLADAIEANKEELARLES